MMYQLQLQPRLDLAPLPEPRAQVRRLMLALAFLIEGPVEQSPGRTDPRLAGCVDLPQAELLLAGTACRRPMLLREANELGEASGLDLIVVRDDEREIATFDVRLQHLDHWLCRCRLWMRGVGETAWLIPSAGGSGFVALTPFGPELRLAAPYESDWDRAAGFKAAARFLKVPGEGWF